MNLLKKDVKMRKVYFFALIVILATAACGKSPTTRPEEYKTVPNIFYLPIPETQADEYQKRQCRLDMYYPKDRKHFATIVFFHGGGLKGGDKFIPEEFKNKGVAVVSVKYRLYPQVKCPVYLQDAAAAVAWTFKNISKYGGDPDSIFVAGHSAGAYLTLMLGLDGKWLKQCGAEADKIAGLIPLSGHTITHMTIREERGIPATRPIADEYAPLYYVRKNTPPILLITGDRELEMLGRYEENAYFARMMKVNENTRITLREFSGYGHGLGPLVYPFALEWMEKVLKERHEKAR